MSGRLTQRGPGSDQIRQRQVEQQKQAAAKAAANQQRLRQQQYLREATGLRRRDEARQRTAELERRVARLTGILRDGLARSARIDLDALLQAAGPASFDPGALGVAAPEPVEEDFARSRLAGMWGGRSGRDRRVSPQEAYEQARAQWVADERERKRRLAEAQRDHEAQAEQSRSESDQYQSRVTRIVSGLRDRDPKVVESFLRTVLRRVPLPAGFPRRAQVSHDPEREAVTIRMVMPGVDVVPDVIEYECEAPRFEVREVPRPEDEIEGLHELVLAQVALLVVRDVFEAETGLDSVSFEGLVDTVAPATGTPDLRTVISLRADRDTFEELDLEDMPVGDALHELNGQVSLDPYASLRG